jgi:GNAT superfamily N-acetyltransferase
LSERFLVRPVIPEDVLAVREILEAHWGASQIISRGKSHQADRLPGFLAFALDNPVGLITYEMAIDTCEIVSLNSLKEGAGIGAALIQAVVTTAKENGCKKLWLITSNDNLNALKFYQKRGFGLTAVYPNAVDQARLIKHNIPLLGNHGIPIRDEIELTLNL